MKKIIAALACLILLAGCSAPARRDEAAYLASLKDTQTRTGYSDARLLTIGDALCQIAKDSKTDAVYILEIDQAMRTNKIPGTGGSMELVLISGSALGHLCPAEGERLRGKS